jgi:hypothetical protein
MGIGQQLVVFGGWVRQLRRSFPFEEVWVCDLSRSEEQSAVSWRLITVTNVAEKEKKMKEKTENTQIRGEDDIEKHLPNNRFLFQSCDIGIDCIYLFASRSKKGNVIFVLQ